MATPVSDFARYAALIEQSIHIGSFSPQIESAGTIQIERSQLFASVLRGTPQLELIHRVLEMSDPSAVSVVDTSSHRRPIYLPLLIYSCLKSFQLTYEILPRTDFGKWEEGLRPWCDHLESQLGDLNLPPGHIPGAMGDQIATAAWTSLALYIAGKVYLRDAWIDLASDFFGRLSRAQQPPGQFLSPTSSDNPETLWYHELVILHAAASYAVQAEDRPLAKSIQLATNYHLNETQPDHATSDPWAIFAFIWNPQTHSVADQLLHTASTSPSPLTATLLADALICVRLFL